jgi:polar amino acid transport system substrate-binding protein
VLPGTRLHWGTPFRQDSAAARNQMEAVIECLKKDGTIARLSQKWFGAEPKPDDAERVVFPGFGPPGLPGYDATPNTATCS